MNYPGYDKFLKKIWLGFLLALFVYWLCFAPAISLASETPVPVLEETRIITITELNTLQMKLNEVSQSNGKLQNELTDWRTSLNLSQIELKQAKQELAAAQEELQALKAESLMLKEKSKNQEQLLKNVNESFKQYGQEVKRERLRIKAQRNTWACVSIALAVVAAIK